MIRLKETLVLQGLEFPELLAQYQWTALLANKAWRDKNFPEYHRLSAEHISAEKELSAAIILSNG